MRAGQGRSRRPAVRGQRGISLIELLIAMAVMSIITAMLLTGWFALSRSYGFTLHSSDARDSGRQAMQRVQREIRDAQRPPTGYLDGSASAAPDAIIYRARPYWIAFSTTFNDLGNATPESSGGATPTPVPSAPHLVVYRLYSDKELWRFEDFDGDGTIQNVDVNVPEGASFNLNEQVNGEGRRLILTDVVNRSNADVAHQVPMFTYNSYDSGTLVEANAVLGADRFSIMAVQIRILVDLNPAKAPVFADLRGTAQLRNARQ
jgi:prepilin-type N-terminal cleavage/methylation domain-containing protein